MSHLSPEKFYFFSPLVRRQSIKNVDTRVPLASLHVCKIDSSSDRQTDWQTDRDTFTGFIFKLALMMPRRLKKHMSCSVIGKRFWGQHSSLKSNQLPCSHYNDAQIARYGSSQGKSSHISCCGSYCSCCCYYLCRSETCSHWTWKLSIFCSSCLVLRF